LQDCSWQDPIPAAASFSALTASSNLQHLNLRGFQHPVEARQHLFVATSKQLPQLKSLTWQTWAEGEQPPQTSSLVSCCPNLLALHITSIKSSTCQELLSPLPVLTGLRVLTLQVKQLQPAEHLLICRLTGLRQLDVFVEQPQTQLLPLWELSALQQLTRLMFNPTGKRLVPLKDVKAVCCFEVGPMTLAACTR
jgi:hypothetical protein